jgi:hypothetical protein
MRERFHRFGIAAKCLVANWLENPVDPAIRALLAFAAMQANELLVVRVSVAVIG